MYVDCRGVKVFTSGIRPIGYRPTWCTPRRTMLIMGLLQRVRPSDAMLSCSYVGLYFLLFQYVYISWMTGVKMVSGQLRPTQVQDWTRPQRKKVLRSKWTYFSLFKRTSANQWRAHILLRWRFRCGRQEEQTRVILQIFVHISSFCYDIDLNWPYTMKEKLVEMTNW